MNPQTVQTEVFAELPARLRKSGSGSGRILRARVATPGRTLFSHL